jgi:hypothetical protein
MSDCSVDQRAPKRQSRSCKQLAALIAVCQSERRKKSNSEALVSQPAYLGVLRVLGSDRCSQKFKSAPMTSGSTLTEIFRWRMERLGAATGSGRAERERARYNGADGISDIEHVAIGNRAGRRQRS